MGDRISKEAPSRRTQSEREGGKGHRALQEEDDAKEHREGLEARQGDLREGSRGHGSLEPLETGSFLGEGSDQCREGQDQDDGNGPRNDSPST